MEQELQLPQDTHYMFCCILLSHRSEDFSLEREIFYLMNRHCNNNKGNGGRLAMEMADLPETQEAYLKFLLSKIRRGLGSVRRFTDTSGIDYCIVIILPDPSSLKVNGNQVVN